MHDSGVCFTGDVVFLKTTGRYTGAVMKVPESFCQFVLSSATRARLGRCSCGTCRSLFFEVCGRLSSSWSCRARPSVFSGVVVSNGLSLDRAQEHVGKHSAWA